jgi:hypothetical protein
MPAGLQLQRECGVREGTRQLDQRATGLRLRAVARRGGGGGCWLSAGSARSLLGTGRGAESQGERCVWTTTTLPPLPVRWHSQKESPSGSVLICAVGHLNPIERLYRCSIITFTITMRGLTTFCTSSSTTLCHCVFANVLLGARRPPCKLCDSQAKTHPRQTVRRCNLCNQRNSSVSYVRSAFTHSMLTSQCCILRLNQSHERIGPPSREKFICRYKHEAADADGS